MDRRVLFATLILFAGGAAGVGVAVFAFGGLDDATAEPEILWSTDPVDGDDGSGAVVATVDGDPAVLQPVRGEDEPGVGVRSVNADGEIEWTVPLPGDPEGTSGLAIGHLADGTAVAVTTDDGRLVVLDAATGTERFVIELDGSGGIQPVFGDLTGDGSVEIVAVDDDGGVLAVDADGDRLFETRLDGRTDLPPILVGADAETGAGTAEDSGANGDADGSPHRGLAVFTDDGEPGTVHLLDGSGEMVWTVTPGVSPLNWNAVDTRRGPILALGGGSGSLETLELSDGSVRYEVGLQDVPIDVGAADAGRVYVGGVGDVWAVDSLDGEVVWKQQYGGKTRVNAPASGDITGDGTLEVLVANRGGDVLGMNRQGEAVARGNVGDEVVYASPLAADLTDDGRDEIIVVIEDGTVVAMSV